MKHIMKSAFLYLLIAGGICFLYFSLRDTFNTWNELTEILKYTIIVGTFIILIGITQYAIGKNREIYRHLLQRESSEHKHMQNQIKRAYLANNKNKGSLSREQIQSIIESYFAQYKIPGKYNVAQRLKLIQTLGSTTILIGVLGTFLGLVLSLRGIDVNDIQESIKPILSGINTAFLTSIAGIICSIIINLHTKIRNSDQLFLNIMLKMENEILAEEQESANDQVVAAIGEVGNEIKSLKQSFDDVQNFSEDFERATNNLNQFNEDFGKSTSRLISMFSNMETIMEAFNERSQQIHNDFGKLFDYFHHQETFQQELYEGVQSSNEKIHTFMNQHQDYQSQQIVNLQNMQQEQQQFFNDTFMNFQTIKEQLEGSIHKSMDTMHNAYESMSNFLNEMLEKQESIVQSQEKFENKNTRLIKQVDEATHTMKEVLENTSFDHLSSVANGLTEQTEKLAATFDHTMNSLDSIQKQGENSAQVLSQINGELSAQANRQVDMQSHFEGHLENYLDRNEALHHSFQDAINIFKEHKSNNEQLSNLAVAMKEEFERNYQLVTNQTSELHTSLQGYIDKTSKQIESFIRQAEANMDENLGKSIKEFRSYVQNTNEILDKRFGSMEQKMVLNDELFIESFASLTQSMKKLDQNIELLAREMENHDEKQLVHEG